MFMRYGYGSGFPLWGAIIGLVLFALLIGAIVWLIVAISRPGRPAGIHSVAGGYGPRFRTPAMEELDVAYARGRVNREEYFRRRADLTGWGPPGGPPGFPGPGPQGSGGDPAAPTSSPS